MPALVFCYTEKHVKIPPSHQ